MTGFQFSGDQRCDGGSRKSRGDVEKPIDEANLSANHRADGDSRIEMAT
jgi:hypothetical protein